MVKYLITIFLLISFFLYGLFPILSFSASITLAWTDTQPNVLNYGIFRQFNCIGPFVKIATISSSLRRFTDGSLIVDQIYCYYITAENGTQTSDRSNVISAIGP